MKWAKEQITTTRHTYLQAPRLIGQRTQITLTELRDLVAATEDYDKHSRVTLEATSVKVVETKQSDWRERGRDKEGEGS